MKEFDDLMDVTGKERRRIYVGFVMDHSGSMMAEAQKSLEGFNTQIQKLKEESGDDIDTLVTLVEFDNEIKSPAENLSVSEIDYQMDYWIGGSTSLYDSIGRCVSIMRRSFDKFEGDKTALIFVTTDGAENSSTEYKGEEGRQKIVKIIKELEETGKWTITFLGQNLDMIYAENIGFSAINTVSFKDRDYGNQVMSRSIGTYYSNVRSGLFENNESLMGDTVAELKEEGIEDEQRV